MTSFYELRCYLVIFLACSGCCILSTRMFFSFLLVICADIKVKVRVLYRDIVLTLSLCLLFIIHITGVVLLLLLLLSTGGNRQHPYYFHFTVVYHDEMIPRCCCAITFLSLFLFLCVRVNELLLRKFEANLTISAFDQDIITRQFLLSF